MSDSADNPYESPQTEAGAVNPLTDRVLTENMVFYLKKASPWLRFIGICGFISLGFSILSILIFAFGVRNMMPDTPEFAPFRAIGPGMAFFYILLLALYFFPILFLFRFGKYLKSYIFTGDNRDLEEALKNNKSLWTFIGILMIISLAFIALVLLIIIVSAIFGAFIR
ncbi:MAG: hypothetical protein FWG29_05805 [Treponema sp.]|nr:hypothetical protein [Treponema sp.]